ncbi:hypothetical protein WA026_013687 [Henosepilachna vigintioctopunctata]|uniref:Uncharacterized protein n=1 Tax=Henosepilachna vigintioctopunctata TaxID=420089 RepID=A0AAW1V0T6_9CUCU
MNNVSCEGRPVVTPSHRNITAVFGQPLTLTMEFCANPPFNKVFWIAKNKVYEPGDADSTVIAYGITNSSAPHCHQAVLFLTKVSTADIGEYIFMVRSPNGISEGNFFVNMTYASGYVVQTTNTILSSNSPSNSAKISHITVIFLLLTYHRLN